MTSDLSQTARPVAISFKDFRDEEIVNFFANENRMFHPETNPNSLGRSRLVGAPHFSIERKNTAASRVSFRSNGLQQEQSPARTRHSILRANPAGTIPVPPDIFTFANENDLQTTIIHKHSPEKHSRNLNSKNLNSKNLTGNPTKNPKRKQLKTIEPAFGKSSRSVILNSVLLPERTDNSPITPIDSSRINCSQTDYTRTDYTRTNKKQSVKIVCDSVCDPVCESVCNPLKKRTQKNLFSPVNTSATSAKETKPSEKTEPTTKQQLPEEPIRETDPQLDRIIETWSRLSSQLKDTITTLLEVSEKDDFSERNFPERNFSEKNIFVS